MVDEFNTFESQCDDDDLECLMEELDFLVGDLPEFESECEEGDLECLSAELDALLEELNWEPEFQSDCDEDDLDCIMEELAAFTADIPDFESSCEDEEDLECLSAELNAMLELFNLPDIVFESMCEEGDLDCIMGELD